MIIKIFQKKWTAWGLLLVPALFFLPQPFIKGLTGYKLWGKELKLTGYIALNFLVLSLLLTPFVRCFPSTPFFKMLNRYRREIGLAFFFYACLHAIAFLLKVYSKKGTIPLHVFLHPFLVPGLLAFLLTAPLALTSSNWAIRHMGWEKWRRLHRLIYASEFLIFFHLILQGGRPLGWALVLFIPLWLFQLARLQKLF